MGCGAPPLCERSFGADDSILPVYRSGRFLAYSLLMYLEAHLDLFTLTKLIQEATPVRLHFGKSSDTPRWIHLASPTSVTLVEGKGVSIETSARVLYAWGGLEPEIEIRRMVLMLSPVVATGDDGLELQFHVDIEEADLVNVPGLIDAGIVSVVNAAITPQNTRMVWTFQKSLRASVPLSNRFEPLVGFSLHATGGSASVHPDHIRLRVAFDSSFTRDAEKVIDPKAAQREALAMARAPDLGVESPIIDAAAIDGDGNIGYE